MPPGLLQDILLEQNLRDLLDLVDRTGYTTSDVMYIVEQMDIVEQTGYVDLVLAKAYRQCLVHGDPAQITP